MSQYEVAHFRSLALMSVVVVSMAPHPAEAQLSRSLADIPIGSEVRAFVSGPAQPDWTGRLVAKSDDSLTIVGHGDSIIVATNSLWRMDVRREPRSIAKGAVRGGLIGAGLAALILPLARGVACALPCEPLPTWRAIAVVVSATGVGAASGAYASVRWNERRRWYLVDIIGAGRGFGDGVGLALSIRF